VNAESDVPLIDSMLTLRGALDEPEADLVEAMEKFSDELWMSGFPTAAIGKASQVIAASARVIHELMKANIDLTTGE
jgi:hypothetical protein